MIHIIVVISCHRKFFLSKKKFLSKGIILYCKKIFLVAGERLISPSNKDITSYKTYFLSQEWFTVARNKSQEPFSVLPNDILFPDFGPYQDQNCSNPVDLLLKKSGYFLTTNKFSSVNHSQRKTFPVEG